MRTHLPNQSNSEFGQKGIRGREFLCFLSLVYSFSSLAQTNSDVNEITALKRIPFEDLLNLEVSTVSKSPQRLVQSPSAIQVITSEDIQRSGASSLPEALRLAANLQVAQVDSRQWAISARGFNSTASDKMLVMIDGRRAYTPLFNGVFWDVQNVVLEDIDRIEVVSGPGASLWGANAVNGVINVISKSARDTQGTLASAGGGSQLTGFGTVRYGDKIGKDLYFRVYGMGFERDETRLRNGAEATNDWHIGQGGFRADWLPPQGEILTVQGDLYGGGIAQPGHNNITVDGQSLLGRWTHPIAEESDVVTQLYYDRTWRRIPGSLAEALESYDFDFQHRLPIGERNKFIWGAGYRLMADNVGNGTVGFMPADKNLQLFSAFLQNEIAVVNEKLFLTIGSKFEHNDYSGFEIEPSGRLAWRMAANQTVWGAISRAVRSPSRLDADIFAPSNPPYAVQGGGGLFTSEKVIAYELGYRHELNRELSYSISTFLNEYDDLRSLEPIPGAVGQTIILNGLRAQTYGVELSATWRALDIWRLRGGYTYFKKHVFIEANDVNQGTGEGNDPHHQFLVQSMVNLPGNFDFDSVVRYVDNLDQLGPTVPGYFSLDLRVAWHPTRNWELALVGQNLVDNQHREFGSLATGQEIPRSVYGKVTWRF